MSWNCGSLLKSLNNSLNNVQVFNLCPLIVLTWWWNVVFTWEYESNFHSYVKINKRKNMTRILVPKGALSWNISIMIWYYEISFIVIWLRMSQRNKWRFLQRDMETNIKLIIECERERREHLKMKVVSW